MAPRYFISPSDPVPVQVQVIELVSAFSVGAKKVAVARIASGALAVVDEDDLSGSEKSALVEMELAHQVQPLGVSTLWLLSLDYMEQAADAQGANDPVHLFGTLTGPWSTTNPATSAAYAVAGRLTVTRGDVLQGFVDRRVVAGFSAALLPGDTHEATARGDGVVLAIPLLQGVDAASGADRGNDVATLHVLAGVLEALHDDLQTLASSSSSFARGPLPCFHRARAVADLEKLGFVVEGDLAKKGGLFSTERRPVPAELTLDEALGVAREAMKALPGFPDPRARVLQGLGRRPFVTTTTVTPPAMMPTTSPPPQKTFTQQPADWMSDFDTPAAPAPTKKTTATTNSTPKKPVRATPISSAARPDWMKDFE